MSGKKGMKKYPVGIREEVVSRIRAGESQRALSREYEISRRAIQCKGTCSSKDTGAQTGKNTGGVQE